MYQQTVLGLERALAGLETMVKAASAEPERPLAFAIVDDHGDLVCFARMDRASSLIRGMAIKKAYTASRMRRDTGAWAERLRDQGRTAQELGDPRLVTFPGGLVVTNPADGSALGGIGVSGRRAEEDEQIARMGLDALGLS